MKLIIRAISWNSLTPIYFRTENRDSRSGGAIQFNFGHGRPRSRPPRANVGAGLPSFGLSVELRTLQAVVS
jgi:hypothetical protein